jgi:mono/diheme cytochrome c family protein
MLKFTRLIFIVLAGLMSFNAPLMAEPTDAEGKELFRNLCASCHNRNMKDKLTGPALGPSTANWADYPREDLYNWIRNSQSMIASGHPRATQLWSEWKPTVMTAFPNLTDEQIESILLYINNVYTGAGQAPKGDGVVATAVEAPAPNNTIYYILFGVLLLLSAFLANIVYNLNYMARRQAGEELPPRKTVWQVLTSKGVVAFIVFALVVLGGYTTVNNAISLGRQQGYAPEQPIKFSHATHAGLHKIDCQYCHDGARRSKHSIIPAANTCMNCHKAIKVGSQYGTAEISKIFASIGFDPSQDKYIENYESLSEEEIEKIYKKWIGDSYVAENGSLDAKGESVIEQQWADIKSSLTNGIKKTIPGPIEWVRIHNLPDHAYFNHAQHVTVGKVECQTCHGKVEEMEVVKQYSPLSMGWCINCHRQTEVKFGDNEYYKNYQKYHEEIKSGKRSKVTVEEIGGLECQKCHY